MLVLRVRVSAAASAPSHVVALLRKIMLPDVYPCRQTIVAAAWRCRWQQTAEWE